MVRCMTDTSRIIAAVATVWDHLRRSHPELPEVAVVIHTTGAPHNLRYAEEEGRIHGVATPPELAIHVDTVRNGGRAVIECVIHMATHALCTARGVSETSNRGRRHNQKFAAMAVELGGHWPDGQSPHPVKGYSPVPISETAMAAMAPYVEALDTVISQVGDLDMATRPAGRSGNRLTLRCECGRTLLMGKRVAGQGPVVCGVCRSEFTAD